MIKCPVCEDEFKSMNGLMKHLIYLAAWSENNDKWIYQTHYLFIKNLHTTEQTNPAREKELRKLGVDESDYLHIGFIPEPKEKMEESSGWGVIQYLWEKADLSTKFSGKMTWQEWEHFTKRHGEEIYFKEPTKCGCIRRWSKGEMEWQELLIHLEVELNYHLSGP